MKRIVRLVFSVCPQNGRGSHLGGLVSLIVVVLLARGAAQQGPNEPPKFRPHPGNPDQWQVVLTDVAAGPRGASSRAAEIAQSLTTLYGGQVRTVWKDAFNGFLLDAGAGIAEAISREPAVAWVEQVVPGGVVDTQFNPPSWGLDRIDQHFLPLNAAYSYNVTGAGVRVYVIDTGIRITHQDFGGRASVGADFVGDGQNGNDCFGHGTHVAGTAGGSSYYLRVLCVLRGLT